MERLPIAKLSPELSALESKQIKAIVTLIWPYSSSARHFALLLAEPDFRLRRKKGQVRVRFSGSGARAIATTGVGIGDEVLLSLQGAQFVQEGVFSTPGKSLDWEISYDQTVVAQIYRDGSELASLELINVAPTPAPQSPVRRQPVALSPLQRWASPAFLKRARLSDGPFFEQPAYNPLGDDNDEGHNKKRRRRSYRDWKAWTYSERTPSPGEEDVDMDEDLEAVEQSPSRPSQLPKTPISPLRRAASPSTKSTSDGSEDNAQQSELGHPENVEGDTVADENVEGDTIANTEEIISPREHHQIYDGANEVPPAHGQYDFGGDTELNTEDEDDAQSEMNSNSAIEDSTEDEEEEEEEEEGEARSGHMHEEPEVVDLQSVSDGSEHPAGEAAIATESSVVEVGEGEEVAKAPATVEIDSRPQHISHAMEHSIVVNDTPLTVMPPPTLPNLRTEFPMPVMSGALTPIGKEPKSPNLEPLDSSTLPMPSPFPGDHGTAASYFEDASINPQLAPLDAPAEDEYELPSDAGYIMETSFFSSISSSKAGTSHPDHESVFTPVRFTFGMDGAGYSRPHDPRPLDLSSPSPEEPSVSVEGPHKQQEDQDINESNVDDDPPQDQNDQDVSGSDVDEEQPKQPNDQPIGRSNVDEVAMPAIDSSSGSEADANETDHMAAQDSNATENSVHNQASRDDESRDDRVVEVSTNEGAALNLGSVTTENQGSQAREQEIPPNNAPQVVSVSKGVDLASPLETGNGEEHTASASQDATLEEHQPENKQHEQQIRGTDEEVQAASSAKNSHSPPLNSHSEFIAMDSTPDHDAPKAVPQQTTAHDSSQQTHDVSFGSGMEFTQISMDEADPFFTMDNSGAWMPHMGFDADLPNISQEGFHMDHYPEIKMESIEDISMFPNNEEGSQMIERHSSASPGEILIEIPDDHHKVGESKVVSVPDTSPARNTRSKTKLSTSPSKEPVSVSKRTTRSTRSKASASADARASLSPSLRRGESVVSISADHIPTSPYNLRSQSRLTSSPTRTMKARPAATRQSPRKSSVPRDTESFSDISASQVGHDNSFAASYEPSQELGLSQSRYSNLTVVEDSEESLRSEDSLSTVQYSDGVQTYMDDMNNPPEHLSQYLESSQLQVPPVISPSRQLRSSSLRRASSTPQIAQKTSHEVHSISPEPQAIDAELGEVGSPTPPQDSANTHLGSSVPPSGNPDEQTRMNTTADHQSPVLESTKLITPDETQHSGMDKQPSFAADPADQVEQSLLTPQLTQATSAGLRSFREETNTEDVSQERQIQLLPVDKSTPQRPTTATEAASSPSVVHSSDASASDNEETLVTAPTLPSVGLSTPLAYYTPLKDLVYFLNRSSQFHSSSNPDILALVTSDSSAASKATKGPRDWTTTLHVTDVSLYPATTTVQVFRAYQNALPVAQKGDVVLLRAFGVRSVKRAPMLASADESSWCVWRFGKPIWGAKRGAWGELRAREEVNGPEVEKGEGEWMEVERLRKWYADKVKEELEGGEQAEKEVDGGDA